MCVYRTLVAMLVSLQYSLCFCSRFVFENYAHLSTQGMLLHVCTCTCLVLVGEGVYCVDVCH